jgi:hypothetical protein
MNDPHVEALCYSVKHGEHVDFTKAMPFDHEDKDFSIQIADGRAQITMKTHFPSLADARAAVEPFLRTWELDMGLRHGPGALEFEYESGQVVDRNPTLGDHTLVAEPGNYKITPSAAKVTISFSTFPTPPGGMARDPVVDLMFARYVLYRDGGTILGDAAYYCLTCLEKDAGNREAAARKFSIERTVLRKLGELSGTKGGDKARKAAGAATDFTSAEATWLEKAMTVIIRRASEVAFDPHAARPQIAMADLPPLSGPPAATKT